MSTIAETLHGIAINDERPYEVICKKLKSVLNTMSWDENYTFNTNYEYYRQLKMSLYLCADRLYSVNGSIDSPISNLEGYRMLTDPIVLNDDPVTSMIANLSAMGIDVSDWVSRETTSIVEAGAWLSNNIDPVKLAEQVEKWEMSYVTPTTET